MTPAPFILTEAERPRALDVVGEKITPLAPAEATGGYEIFLQEGPEGSGPPPHSHAWDETFYVTEGELEIGYGEVVALAPPGTLIHLPAGTVHWFRFGSGGGRMLSITGAGSQATRLFTDIDAAMAPGRPDLALLAVVAGRNGVTVDG